VDQQTSNEEVLKNTIFDSNMSEGEYKDITQNLKLRASDVNLPILTFKALNTELGLVPGNIELRLDEKVLSAVSKITIDFDAKQNVAVATIKIPVKLKL